MGSPRRRQSGLSIVELMVGVALGLFVVAAAALMVSSQLAENRKLLLETQLQQDLRATVDIISRELRRSSFSPLTTAQVWYQGSTTPPVESIFGSMTPNSGDNLTQFEFTYRRRSGDEGPFGFKLDSQAIKSKIGGTWQVLTDSNVMRVTALDVDLSAPVVYQLPCPRLCDDGTRACWPELQMRVGTISLTGQSIHDANVIRTLRTRVRVRNDWPHFNAAQICPT